MNQETATDLIYKFKSKFNELLLLPLSFLLVESKLIYEINQRKCIVDNYIVLYFYNAKDKLVEIVRVIYSKIDYLQAL
ncbi:hypothetical protein MPAN_016090 [Mariniplasma anaerobium]|uniref:Type II toxin-antitoxin system RelE/ParE family toxin n=1 Tax=Mariniplasma anaerobium TaxID=2735436 RepID=A0A7U9TJX3_9MOLU|nr:hypothetical protein MPAN_016090 [Mariniplasma anaerobium]